MYLLHGFQNLEYNTVMHFHCLGIIIGQIYFHHFSLVGKVITEIIEDKVENAILVFPFWKSQSWFPLLLDNLCSFPVRLPRHKDLLVLPHNGRCHPLCKSMQIISVTVSGRCSIIEDFRKQLQTFSSALGGLGPGSSTDQPCRNGLFGKVSGLEIPFRPLRWWLLDF